MFTRILIDLMNQIGITNKKKHTQNKIRKKVVLLLRMPNIKKNKKFVSISSITFEIVCLLPLNKCLLYIKVEPFFSLVFYIRRNNNICVNDHLNFEWMTQAYNLSDKCDQSKANLLHGQFLK